MVSVLIRRFSAVAMALAFDGGAWADAGAQEADPNQSPPVENEQVESVVVTPSRTKTVRQWAPAPVTVVTNDFIEHAPANDLGQLLRTVEGLNVIQISARDYQVAGRSASGSLSTGQLVLVDGRTVYLDFFGFVMWDLIPIDSDEIKQIEVVRGPGSAVWGANALTGVINVVTKSPRELVGPSAVSTLGQYAQRTTLVGGGGEYETAYANLTHAGVRDKLSYKITGGYSRQDAFPRPTGTVPGTTTPYPQFENRGTEQPKFEARVDYDLGRWSECSVSGGYSGTDGILHSGIGPFDIDTGTYLAHGRASYERRSLNVLFFSNILDGDATNLLTRDSNGAPIRMTFKTQKYNLDITNTTLIGSRHSFTYGFNARANRFDLTIAPRGENRDEVGVFAQDEAQIYRNARVIAGVRWDNLDPIGSVWSPRASFVVSPLENHVFRISFGQAFRAPSMVQNFLEIDIVNQVTLSNGMAYTFPSAARGNENLTEEELTSFEGGWVGQLHDDVEVSVSIYRNQLEHNIDFFPSEFYSSTDPPPNWPFPPNTVPPNTFPKVFTYRNIGEIVNWGFEIGLRTRPIRDWSAFANYSWQADPEAKGIAREEINTPPRNRVNFGVGYDPGRFFASTDLSFVDNAFWTDVLDQRFWGPTESYRMWNAKGGVRFAKGRVTIAATCVNLLNEGIQQHVFGDIIPRRFGGELRLMY